MGNILQTHDKCTDCGLSATPDELTRNFAYDPLYRLLNATGRESNTQSSSVIWNNPPITQVRIQNSRTTRKRFNTTKLGNIQKLQHIGNNNFTREFDYTNANNKLNNINVGLNTYNYLYDDTGNLIKKTVIAILNGILAIICVAFTTKRVRQNLLFMRNICTIAQVIV
ncbi:MAG: hypothetical protein R2779_04290 [Crocinitomicaceae bacterium]